MKRYFIIFLIFSLFVSQSYAIGLEKAFNGTVVSSNFGTWDSPRTGTRYFYGGSYTFAFKGAGRYQPFFQGESPSFKVGCNGFSLSGGFLALLGIDEIKVLLKNAGATLAWGLMMGLEYTMPALAKVFATLRKWAREIQTILENACNLGKVIAKNTGLTKTLNGATNGFTGKINDMFDNLNKGMEGVDNTLTDFYKDATDGCAGLTDTALKACKNKVASGATTKGVENLAKNSAATLTSYAIGSYAKDAADSSNNINISHMSNFFSTGKIGDKTIVSNADILSNIKTTILIARLFFGDLATPTNSIEELLKNTGTGATSPAIAEGTFKLNAQKVKNKNLAALTAQIKDIGQGMTVINPVISSDEQAAKALINGITTRTADLCYDGYCKIPNSYLYYIDYAYTQEGKQKTRILGNINTGAASDTLKVEWDGGYKESLRVIRQLVKNKTGFNPTFKTMGETSSAETTDPTATSIKIPLLLPNIQRYLKSIIYLERQAKKETAYTAQLKDMLARYNGYFFAESMIDLISGKITDAIGARGDPVGNPDIAKLRGYLDGVQTRRAAILKKIKEEMANQISYKELAEIFEKVDTNIKIQSIKGY